MLAGVTRQYPIWEIAVSTIVDRILPGRALAQKRRTHIFYIDNCREKKIEKDLKKFKKLLTNQQICDIILLYLKESTEKTTNNEREKKL